MRTLHVISTLNPAAGGPAEFVLTLLAHPASGDTAEVVTLDDPAAPWLANLPAHGLGPIHSVYAYSPALTPWLRANHSRFDVVIVHGLWQFCGFSTGRAIRKHKPYLVFPHGMLDPYFKYRFPAKHLKKWLYWLAAEYWVLRGATRVLFTTEEESRLARKSFWLHRWNPQVVPFGTMPPPASPDAQKQAFFQAIPAVEGKRFLLFLGRIHPKKGFDLLLEAFTHIGADDPNLHLVMAGPSSAPQPRQTDPTHRIHWPGLLTGDAKWGAFRAAEAFVLPSHQENFGIAVAEALACACPVLLSGKVNIAPEIAQDQAGFVDTDNVEGTERLLRRWLATPSAEREAISRNALACFERRYDLRRNLPEINRLLRPQPDDIR